jgi:hypothetical protein
MRCMPSPPAPLPLKGGGSEAFFGVVMMQTTAPVTYRIPMHTNAPCTPSFNPAPASRSGVPPANGYGIRWRFSIITNSFSVRP